MTKRMWVSERALLNSCLPLFTQLSPETGVAVKRRFTGSSKNVNVESLVEFCTLYENRTFSMMLPHQHSNQLNSSIARLLQDSLRDSGKTQWKGFSLI